jgi:hypothetical protein
MVSQASANVRVSSIGSGIDQGAGLSLVARDAAGSDRDRPTAENARLRREIERLQQENEDLRKSAEIWIRLYEKQLARARCALDLLAHCRRSVPR